MINVVDLFAGCGGLMDGFEKEGHYRTLCCVEWDKDPCLNLKNRLKTKWNHTNADKEVIRFDLRRTDELFDGYNDEKYGESVGMDSIVGDNKVDVIIGGPPCQAYSLAGRIRDKHGMRDDYRNYLFESYIRVVKHYKPKLFVFENVQGILSAMPDGTPIVDAIKQGFKSIGYDTIGSFKKALIDLSEYGIPQKRKRVIILGVSQEYYKGKTGEIINQFYNYYLKKYVVCKHLTVRDAIEDLPSLKPLKEIKTINGARVSHEVCEDNKIKNHFPRFHNKRDIEIFRMLAEDIEKKIFKYDDIDELKKLYTKKTGKKSNIHKYNVLKWDEPSNTIPAHLYKDGLRHIHPDSAQARTITVREAARLQTFDDDYEFIGGRMSQYKMIGNAVPPKFSLVLAKCIKSILEKY